MFFDFMVHSISVYVDNFSERTNGSSSPKRNILIKNPMDKEFFQCLGFVFPPCILLDNVQPRFLTMF
jgi:hypothetical protein